ncbi:TLR4 interactor with leucine rich repeats [Entelurus aequoreus]|uniref:TLR4 interactor with leucine rich repeats n=1 Tax=Entelurus aequoreus TaxID=161455 RepID=UPI002B1E3852|nr:TLR4 interactor with leucine rich repeats [Entelurus aequoreus]
MDTGYFLARTYFFLLFLHGFTYSFSSFPAVGVCPSRCDCQHPQHLMCANRGLPTVPPHSSNQEEVLVFSLGGNFIANISALDLARYTALVRLDLQFNRIQNIHREAFERLSSLEELYLGHNRLSHFEAGTLKPLKKLTVLYVNNNDILHVYQQLFTSLDHLVKLRLDGNRIESLQDSVFKDLTNLRYLHLESNNLQHIHKNAFSELAHLRFLNLSHNKLSTLRGALTFSHLQALTTLLLSGNAIRHVGNKMFQNLQRLSKLSLSNNSITHLGRRTLLGLSSLKELFVDGNELEEIPAELLDPLKLIEHLDISRNRISNVDSLAFMHLKHLQVLKLNDNILTSLSGDAFRLNPFLRDVDLRGNNWTCDCRMQALKSWMSAVHSEGKLLDVLVQCHHPASLRGTYLDNVNSSQLEAIGNRTHLGRGRGEPKESQGGKLWIKIMQDETGRKREEQVQRDQGGKEPELSPSIEHKESLRSKSRKRAKMGPKSKPQSQQGFPTPSHAGNQRRTPTPSVPSRERFDLLRMYHKWGPSVVTDPCVFNHIVITNVTVDQITSSTVVVYWTTRENLGLDEVQYRILFDRFGTPDRFPRYVYAPASSRSVTLQELSPDVTYMVCVEGVVAGSVCQVAPRDHCSGLVTLPEKHASATSDLQLLTVLTVAGNAVLLLVIGGVWLGRSLKKKLQRRKSAVHVRHMYSTRRPFRPNVASASVSADFTSYQSSRLARLIQPELGDLIEFPCDRFQDTGSSRRDNDLPRFSD